MYKTKTQLSHIYDLKIQLSLIYVDSKSFNRSSAMDQYAIFIYFEAEENTRFNTICNFCPLCLKQVEQMAIETVFTNGPIYHLLCPNPQVC